MHLPHQASNSSPTERIRDFALKLGFDAVGFSRAELDARVREHLVAFLDAGCHGDMGWLANRVDHRAHPQSLWPAACSVVVVGLSYSPADDPRRITQLRSQGAVSVYAQNRDYHTLIKGRLKHLAQFLVSRFACQVKVFVDTAPVMEKPLAERAGLGWQGKHTNVVSRSHGSWLLLGEIYTDLDLQPDTRSANHCGSCSNCLDVCPTRAFTAPYQLDARRCISYLTIEHRGPIPLELRSMMGNHIYGCDDCLAVCPWNKFAVPTTHQAMVGRADLQAPDLAKLAVINDQQFRRMFSGSPVKRIGRNRFVRNVAIAIGNSNDQNLRPVADTLRHDQDLVVADAANWAFERLSE